MEYTNLLIQHLPYAHRLIQENSFIFPITGLELSLNSKVSVGKIDFVDQKYLYNNIIKNELASNILFNKSFEAVRIFAIVNLDRYGEVKGICSYGNNSLALQILKQTIGAIYLSIFNTIDNVDFERRIVISNKGVQEVDEGLNSYLAMCNNEYVIVPNYVDKMLIANCNDFNLKSIENIITILNKPYTEKNEYEKKICKSLELIYSIYNESYSRERIIKWSILLNYLFRETNEQNISSHNIGRKLKIIFNEIEDKCILENLPKYISPEVKETKKISDIIINIYSRVRNDIMHGKIDFYEEYAVCNLEDLIILKITVMKLLTIMANDKYLTKFKDVKEFNQFIEEKHKEYVEIQKNK